MKSLIVLISVLITSFLYSQTESLPRIINFDDQIIHHTAYTLSYNEGCEQPNWVKYLVTEEDLSKDVAKRKNNFKEDTSVITGSATLDDYKSSGYDRGHLAPAATFVDSQKEMDESFFMSNMSPQDPSFNRGVWKRIEEYERKMAIEKDSVWVICGPILTDDLKTIGINKVCVPELYFKIIYSGDWVICFILKNEKSSDPLYTFNQPLDVIQREAKINFMLNNNKE